MKKTVTFMGKPCVLENNALLPRKYRHIFGRDLVVDMQQMATAYKKDPTNCSTEVLENLTWLMMREGGEKVGDSVEEWLAGIDDVIAVYEVAGDIMELWAAGRKTTSIPKKR